MEEFDFLETPVRIWIDKFSENVVMETETCVHKFVDLDAVRSHAIAMLNAVNKLDHSLKVPQKGVRKGRIIGKNYAKRAISDLEAFLAESDTSHTDDAGGVNP